MTGTDGSGAVKPSTKDYNPHNTKLCLACRASSSVYWRDCWTDSQGHLVSLCNSCGLRYKKSSLACNRCLSVPYKADSPGLNILCKICQLGNYFNPNHKMIPVRAVLECRSLIFDFYPDYDNPRLADALIEWEKEHGICNSGGGGGGGDRGDINPHNDPNHLKNNNNNDSINNTLFSPVNQYQHHHQNGHTTAINTTSSTMANSLNPIISIISIPTTGSAGSLFRPQSSTSAASASRRGSASSSPGIDAFLQQHQQQLHLPHNAHPQLLNNLSHNPLLPAHHNTNHINHPNSSSGSGGSGTLGANTAQTGYMTTSHSSLGNNNGSGSGLVKGAVNINSVGGGIEVDQNGYTSLRSLRPSSAATVFHPNQSGVHSTGLPLGQQQQQQQH